jgi:hypothetical protein
VSLEIVFPVDVEVDAFGLDRVGELTSCDSTKAMRGRAVGKVRVDGASGITWKPAVESELAGVICRDRIGSDGGRRDRPGLA